MDVIAIILSRGLGAKIRQVGAYSKVAVIGIPSPFLASTSVAPAVMAQR